MTTQPKPQPQPISSTTEPRTTIINGKHYVVEPGKGGTVGERTIRHYPDRSILRVYTEDANNQKLLSGRFGDGVVTTTGGGGGWVAVPRPQKKPITVWRGPQDGYQHEIPLIFDTYGTSFAPIETEMGWLEYFAGVDMFVSEQPPVLILNAGGALPHDVINSPQLRWIIPEEPVWGEAIRRRDTGERVRQLVTVKFMVFNQGDELSRTVPTQVHSKYVYVAKAGDTYKGIAARQLKNEGGVRWANRLAQLNGARDGASKTRAGQNIKLPTPAELKSWKQKPRR